MLHFVKDRNFTKFPGVDILWKLSKNGQKYSNNSSAVANELLECVWQFTFAQNVHTRKLGDYYGILRSVCVSNLDLYSLCIILCKMGHHLPRIFLYMDETRICMSIFAKL